MDAPTSPERAAQPYRIRLIIVGAGGGRGAWFTRQAATLARQAPHPPYELVALVDQLPEAARLVAEDCGLAGVPVYAATEEALAAAPCDAVLVATPDGQHVAPVLAALAQGKHVYVEKPLAITLEDCLAIARADRAAGGRTMVGFNLRYAPLYRRMRQMIAEGAIGRVLTIQADEFYAGGRTYFRRWNRLRRYGGGLWITKASHDFDLLYWLAGTEPQRVSAIARLTHYRPKAGAGMRCRDCALEPDCPDSHLRDLQHAPPLTRQIQALREAAGWPPADLCLYNSDKDTFDHGIAQVSFAEDILATYTLNVVAPFTDRRMRIGGTEGTLEGSLSRPELLYWRRPAWGRASAPPIDSSQAQRIPLFAEDPGGHGGGDRFLLDDFAALVRDPAHRPISPAEASVAVALGLAATHASDAERTVAMAELPGWAALQAALAERAP